jgi:hypothetical protein
MSSNSLALELSRIWNFRTLDSDQWSCFEADYNVRGCYSYLSNKQGKVFVMVDPAGRLREGYYSQGKWDFIRHVELGELEDITEETDPEKLLKIV